MPSVYPIIEPVPPQAPTPDRQHGDRSPADQLRRQLRDERRESEEIRATESPEEHDKRVHDIWVNYDGKTYTSDRISLEAVAREASHHSSECHCWRHAVIAHVRRIVEAES